MYLLTLPHQIRCQNYIDINFYLLQEDVTKAVEERKKKEEKDKRNLYLANEGLIREGTKVG